MKKTAYFFDHEMLQMGSAIEKIENLFDNHFRSFSQSPSLVTAIFSEEMFRNEAGLSRKVKEIMDRNIAGMRLLIEEGQRDGSVRVDIEAEQLAIILLGSLRIFLKIWHLDGRRYSVEDEGAVFVKSIEILIRPI
jgi:hypothetical protein